MGRTRHAIIIGVEKYQKLNPCLHAEADARAIGTALEDLGWPRENVHTLVNEEASIGAIGGEIETVLGSLMPTDSCVLFYAGHGFSDGERNYLSGYDTRLDVASTQLSLQRVMGLIKECKATQMVIFLDACHTGLIVEDSMRATVTGIGDIADAEYCVGFASCRRNEKSYSSSRLKHGIWTYHLLQALRGEVNSVLEGGGLVAAKLQEYLADSVPRTLREEHTEPKVQRPRFFGSFERVPVIADLGPILERRVAAQGAKVRSLKRVSLVASDHEQIVRMTGFSKKRGHFEPEAVSSSARRFVQHLGHAQATADAKAVHEALRTQLTPKLKRRDLRLDEADGGATVRTPWFDYHVRVTQDDEDPSLAVWRYEITNIHDATVFEREDIGAVLAGRFNTVEFVFAAGTSPNMAELIDQLEDAGYDVDYPANHSYAEFRPEASDATVRVTPNTVEFRFRDRLPPKALVDGFRSAQAALFGESVFTKLLVG